MIVAAGVTFCRIVHPLAFLAVLGHVGACHPPERAADRAVTSTATAATGDCSDTRPSQRVGTRIVAVYFACDGDVPGQLYPVYRRLPESADPVRGALEAMLRGPTALEQTRSFRSLFSVATAGMLRGVTSNATGDTITIDFADFRSVLGEGRNPTSFGPDGIMGSITWTVFRQFPAVDAVRFSFDGDERAFWSWIAGERSEPQVYTREDWEHF